MTSFLLLPSSQLEYVSYASLPVSSSSACLQGISRRPSEHWELISPEILPRPDPTDQSPPTPVGASSAPVEILQHIFTFDAESYGGFRFRPDAKHPALRLAHVSRAWRAAALGTSVLWSRLEANINPNFMMVCANGSAWQWRSALDQFLVLAQEFPLHISLACSGMPRWRIDEEIQAIVAALLHTAPRWKSLSLWLQVDSDEEDGDWSFLDPLHDRLDSLEKLHVIVSGHDIPVSRFTAFSLCRLTAFRDTPKLVRISTENVILVELPWSHLLHVDFTFDQIVSGDEADQFALIMQDFLVGLQKADQLKTLSCGEWYIRQNAVNAPIMADLELPCLEEITLSTSSQLVRRVVLPSLSKLHIHESIPYSDGDLAPSAHWIQSLVVRSKCAIISLTISHARAFITLDGLRDIAHHLPQLVSFRLERDTMHRMSPPYDSKRGSRCNISLHVFSLLTSSHVSGHALFPLLQNVSISICADSLDPDDLFRIFPNLSGMLASRRTQPDSATARVYAHARVYRPTQTQKMLSEDSVTGPYHRYSEVEDDARWQMLTDGYHGQINVLIEVLGISTSEYDYQVWLGRTPEPGNFWQ
ncbi:hypothetical protein BDZ89DRAFT_1066466 [Hymenopellis radicata]|nr:hypothetical protein BDZ89DRAFT_1066466 [Hymenopellis radicata]